MFKLLIIFITFISLSEFSLSDSVFSKETIENGIKEYFKNDEYQTKIDFISPINDINFQEENISAEIEANESLIGFSTINLVFKNKEKVISEKSVNIKIRAFANLLVSKINLSKDQKINNENIENQFVEISSLEDIKNNKFQFANLSALKSIPKASILNKLHFTGNKSFKRGEKVNVYASSNGITIKTTATLIDNSLVGNITRAQKENTREILEGILQDDGSIWVLK